jgi:hypothetical protein
VAVTGVIILPDNFNNFNGKGMKKMLVLLRARLPAAHLSPG